MAEGTVITSYPAAVLAQDGAPKYSKLFTVGTGAEDYMSYPKYMWSKLIGPVLGQYFGTFKSSRTPAGMAENITAVADFAHPTASLPIITNKARVTDATDQVAMDWGLLGPTGDAAGAGFAPTTMAPMRLLGHMHSKWFTLANTGQSLAERLATLWDGPFGDGSALAIGIGGNEGMYYDQDIDGEPIAEPGLEAVTDRLGALTAPSWPAEHAAPALPDPESETLLAEFRHGQIASLDEEIFPAAQLQFLVSNTVFTGVFARFVLDRYRDACNKTNELAASLLSQGYSSRLQATANIFGTEVQREGQKAALSGQVFQTKAQSALEHLKAQATLDGTIYQRKSESASQKQNRLVEMEKASSQRAHNRFIAMSDTVSNVFKIEAAQNELVFKLMVATLQAWYQIDFQERKTRYTRDVTAARWELDASRYVSEALAALHGGIQTQKQSYESGFNAMAPFEKAVSIGSAITSLGGGIASLGKDLSLW